MENATRIVYWQISNVWLMYVLLIPTLAVFGYGLYRRYVLWQRLGKPTDRLGDIRARLRRVWIYVIGHKRFFREGVAGWMHALIMWSMALLFIGTLVVAIDTDLKIPIMRGWFYLIFQKLILNLAGLFLTVGLAVALVRRYVSKVARVQPNRPGVAKDPSDALSLFWLLLLMVQGFALQAFRLAANPDPYAIWSPIGHGLSLLLAGVPQPTLVFLYQVTWWFHLLTTFSWIAWLPFSKMIHIFTSTASVFTSNLSGHPPALQPIDFEKAERLGVSAISDFAWKDLLDLDACTSCGRCQAVCPAYASGTQLSPRNLILDLRDYMSAHGPGLIAGQKQTEELPPLVGGAITEEVLWACTSCGACMQECPVHIEHVPKIVDMRRHLVMEESNMPGTLQEALKSLEDRAHPYKGANAGRTDWCEGLEIPVASEVGEVDVLYWVGCTAAFDARNQKVARSFAQLMQTADVKFAILGNEEACCGDPARRMGNEFLYEQMARTNVETLQMYKPKKIVTACPHCFQALGNEYRQFGGEFEVVHHTQLLKELVDEGRLKVRPEQASKVTYHDPCYLGRYNGEYESPRDLIDATGGERLEMERSRSKSFCCGAGGGHAWMEAEGEGPRINQQRAAEAMATGAETVAVSCPFCMQMMEDGVKTSDAGEGAPKVRDVAELLLEAVEETGPHTLSKG